MWPMNQAWNGEDERRFAGLKQQWVEANRREIEMATQMGEAIAHDDVKLIQDFDNRLRHQREQTEMIWDDYLPMLRRRNAPNDDNA